MPEKDYWGGLYANAKRIVSDAKKRGVSPRYVFCSERNAQKCKSVRK